MSLADPAVTARSREALAVRRLRLHDFRSFHDLTLEVGPGIVVLVGENGAGKTNLLEAVSLLAPGRGLRGARLADLVRRGHAAWSVAARVEAPEGPLDVVTGQNMGAERRAFRVDGAAPRRSAELAAQLGIVWLTPAMDRLFAESAGERRRFLDRLVLTSDPAYAKAYAVYARDLRERSEVLREPMPDPAWLAVLEHRLAENGVAIAAARRALVDDLNATLTAEPGHFPRPILTAAGEVERWLDDGPALDAEDRLRAALLANRRRDAELGGAAVGPHRSDLVAVDAATGTPSHLASTGRQKALLIAIVLAEARLRLQRLGATPLLLLDEVAAHLDARRRSALAEALHDLGTQAWISGTERQPLAALAGRASFLHLRDGTIAHE